MKRYESYKDSGVYYLPLLPSKWEIKKAKFLFREEKRLPRINDEIITCFRDGQVTLRKNRRTEGFTNSLKEIGYKGIRKGDLVIHNMDAFAGAIGVSDSDGKGTPVYSICTTLSDNISPYYYCYFLRYLAKCDFIKSLSKGIRERSTDFRFNDFKELILPVPSIYEQNKIVEYIDSVTSKIDEAISQQQKMIDLLNERKQIIIQNAVTKGLDPNAKMKDSGVEWIGEIPEGWERTYLKHIYVFEKGKNAQLYSSEYIGRNIGKYPVYSGQTENDGIMGYVNVCEYNIDECIFTTTVGAKVMTPRILRGKFTLSQNCLIMIPKNKPHHNLYIFYALSIIFRYMKSEIPSYMQPSLRISDLNRISMYLPPYKTQIDIANFLKQNLYKIDFSINMSNKMISLLQERKQIIINDVVTGKVKVI